jgi:hypothetical protein
MNEQLRTEHPEHLSDKYAIKIIHPFYNSQRILAQDGAFTLHLDPQYPLESLAGKPFASFNLDIERLYNWIIPAECKMDIIKQLSGLGITRRAVYPDLDGIAGSLRETEALWSKNASTN